VNGAAFVNMGSVPPLPQKFAITASILAKSAQSSNGLNKNGIPKRANDRIDEGSSERVAALALGGLEPIAEAPKSRCVRSQHQHCRP
jgi:hypothetical protein